MQMGMEWCEGPAVHLPPNSWSDMVGGQDIAIVRDVALVGRESACE